VLKIRTSNEEFYRCFTQGVADMAALRLPIRGTDHMVFVPAAGLPWFVALFGRDSLIVSLQTMLVYPDFARGALDVLGAYQAQERDDHRDAEPGKILHELRYGELAHFRLIPHTPYYGTSDATPLYLVALHFAWRATGDRSLIEKHLRTAEGCLAWIDAHGDRDGDGFQEYQTHSSAGYENTGWKDSGDAVMYKDGTLVKGPKALCELQGYVYDAWLRMAQIYDEIGGHERAKHLREKAAALFQKFNELFWNEELGFYAYTLDGDKKPVFSIASQPRPLPVVRHRAQGPRRPRGGAIDAAGHVERLGHPHALSAAQIIQSIQLPDWRGVAARQRHHRPRLPPLRLRRRGGGGRPLYQRRREPLPVKPAARALCRAATGERQLPSAVHRRQRAAGVGRGHAVRAAADDARHTTGRAAWPALR
jgi:Amylo-alpha-1,6-glucosidase